MELLREMSLGPLFMPNDNGPRQRINGAYVIGKVAIITAIVIVTIIAFPCYQLYELRKVRYELSVDAEIYNLYTERNKPTSGEDFLNPPYLKKYNFSMLDYVDSKGYVNLNGTNWCSWSFRTKIVYLLWVRDDKSRSDWQLYELIRGITHYYDANNMNSLLSDVSQAVQKNQ